MESRIFKKHKILLLSLIVFLIFLVTPVANASFIDSGQNIGNSWSHGVTLGDLDGDGDLDAFVVNYNGEPNRVWLNDGTGVFVDSGQILGSSWSWDVELGDLDGDGNLDAFVANYGSNTVWINDGAGNFTGPDQFIGSSYSVSVALGDLDGDGDLDAFVVNNNSESDRVWFNKGNGIYTDSGQLIGSSSGWDVALGDLDNDGDLDAFIANESANQIWLNNGNGGFSDSGQLLGSAFSTGVALGDLDGDGDLDAFVANYGEPDKIWLNDGNGIFTDSGLTFGNFYSASVVLNDLDGDGDLDAFVAHYGEPNTVWINTGNGIFVDSGQSLGNDWGWDVAAGDVDGDGLVDIFVGNANDTANRLWKNINLVLSTTVEPPDTGEIFSDYFSCSTNCTFNIHPGTEVIMNVWLKKDGYYFAEWSGCDSVSGLSCIIAMDDNRSVTAIFKRIFTLDVIVDSSTSGGVTGGDINIAGDEIDCPGVCSKSYREGTTVKLTAIPNPGYKFIGWTGCNSVKNNVCTVSMTAEKTIVAMFKPEEFGFADSTQSLGARSSLWAELGDLDGDGDLDAFVANDGANTVWLNDGSGYFTDSGQSLGNAYTTSVALGDLDGDGDLDAFVMNHGPNKIWLNDGNGIFSDSGQTLGSYDGREVVLADIDGDGDLDAVLANYSNQPNSIWLNDGKGNFTDSGQALGNSKSHGVAVGDLDGDGDLDMFVSNREGQSNRVWLNDGNGSFSDSGQLLGSRDSAGVRLGDLDGDGDLDAFVTNYNQPNIIWLNDGTGNFTDSGQRLGTAKSRSVMLGDLDGDGDLDAFVANNGANRFWLNDGTGNFTADPQIIGNSSSQDVALGDLDGDGDLDAFVSNFLKQPNKVWLNNEHVLKVDVNGNGKAVGFGINCPGDCKETFIYGRSVDLTAIPDAGYFSNWSGCVAVSGDVCTIVMDDFNKTVTVEFQEISPQLTVGVNPTGAGSVTGSGIDCPGDCTEVYQNGDQVVLTATTAGGYRLEGWTGCDSMANDTCTVRMELTREVKAVYVPAGFGFTDSGQNLGSATSFGAGIGDFDSDGDLDVFVANKGANTIWVNDGTGQFVDSGQSLGNSNSRSVAIGDLDGDGDLDAFVANNGANRVWLNDGNGNFVDSAQGLGNSDSRGVAIGDLDGDGDLDAFVANYNQPSKIWLNDGSGNFIDSGQNLWNMSTVWIALGDLDEDEDLDAFVANSSNQPNTVWLNDGKGNFIDSGQSLGSLDSRKIALADFDGDGDLDAFVVNNAQPNKVWFNDGTGVYVDSGQSLGDSISYSVLIGDLDGDGDLDAFVANNGANRVWLNDGNGNFIDSGRGLGNSDSRGVALGDLDGDADLDAFVVNSDYIIPPLPVGNLDSDDTDTFTTSNIQANKVWLNDEHTIHLTVTGNGRLVGSGLDCPGVCNGDFDFGASIELTALPDSGNMVAEWTGCDTVNGNVCSITINDFIQTVSVRFAKSYQLNVTVDPLYGGRIMADGIDCPGDCVEMYPEGANVVITAEPSPGFLFEGWHVDNCLGVSPCSVTMTTDLQVNARFFSSPSINNQSHVIHGADAVTLKCDVNPQGLNTSVWFEWGEVSVDENNTISKNIGSGTVSRSVETLIHGLLPGTTYIYRCVALNMMGYAYGSEQIFQTDTSSHVLRVIKSGPGTVISTPAGIDCGSNCMASFNSGADVTLDITSPPGFLATIKVDGVIEGIGTSYTFNALDSYHLVEIQFSPYEYVFFESFTDGIPNDWTINDSGNTRDTWTDSDICENGSPFITDMFQTPWVMVDSNCAGQVDIDEELITPPIDAGGCSQLVVEFNNQFHTVTGSEIGDLDISIDGGATWVNVLKITGSDDGYDFPNVKRIDISNQVTGKTTVMLRWHYYNANDGGWWAIDNVGVICNSPPETMVLIPNGKEHLSSGGIQTVTWTAIPDAASFNLDYSINGGSTWKNIATGVTGTSYEWSVPAVAGNKRKCLVRVTAYDSNGTQIAQDMSDGWFMIEVVRITSPHGGETFNAGDTVPITWTTNATKTPVTKVVLKYHKVGTPGWKLITVLKGDNPGSYEWTIPTNITSGEYRIKINLFDADGNRRGGDKTDGVFTVQ